MDSFRKLGNDSLLSMDQADIRQINLSGRSDSDFLKSPFNHSSKKSVEQNSPLFNLQENDINYGIIPSFNYDRKSNSNQLKVSGYQKKLKQEDPHFESHSFNNSSKGSKIGQQKSPKILQRSQSSSKIDKSQKPRVKQLVNVASQPYYFEDQSRKKPQQSKKKIFNKKNQSNYEMFNDNSDVFQYNQDRESQSSFFENKIVGSKVHSIEQIRALIQQKQQKQIIMQPEEAEYLYHNLRKLLQINPEKFSMFLDPNFNKQKLWAENFIDKYQQIRKKINKDTLKDFQKEVLTDKIYTLGLDKEIEDLNSEFAKTRQKNLDKKDQLKNKNKNQQSVKSKWQGKAYYKDNIFHQQQLLGQKGQGINQNFFKSSRYFSRVREEDRNRKKPFSSKQILAQSPKYQKSFKNSQKSNALKQSRDLIIQQRQKSRVSQMQKIKRSRSLRNSKSLQANFINKKFPVNKMPQAKYEEKEHWQNNQKAQHQYFPILKSQTGIQTQKQRNSIFQKKYKRYFQITSNISQTIKSQSNLSFSKSKGRRNKIFSASIVSKNMNNSRSRKFNQIQQSRKRQQNFNEYGINNKVEIRKSNGLSVSRSSSSIAKTKRYFNGSKHNEEQVQRDKKNYNEIYQQYYPQSYGQIVNPRTRIFKSQIETKNMSIIPASHYIQNQYLTKNHIHNNRHGQVYKSRRQPRNQNIIITPLNNMKFNQNNRSPTSINAFQLYSATPQANINRSNKKLSAHSLEKQTRKQTMPRANLDKNQIKYIDNFAKHFTSNQDFWRFRRNCFEDNIGLYASDSLYVSGIFQLQGKTLNLSILYVNKSRQQMNIEVVYKIPKCYKIQKKNQIKKKFVLQPKGQHDFSCTHIFSLSIHDLSIQPCLVNLRYRNSEINALKRQITLPITIKNFCKAIMTSHNQWQAKYLKSSDQQTSIRRFCTIQLDHRIYLEQVDSVFNDFIDLPAIQYYSVLEKGVMYLINIEDPFSGQIVKNQLILRMVFKSEKILIIQSLVQLKRSNKYDLVDMFIEELQKTFIMLLSTVSGNKF